MDLHFGREVETCVEDLTGDKPAPTMMRGFWIPALLISVCASQALAASFDCTKAASAVEKAVCADPELSKLDDQMATVYTGLLAGISASAASQVRQDQREWIRWLPQICSKQTAREFTACLMNEYSRQVAAFKNQPERVARIVFFPRIKVVALPNKAQPLPYVKRFDFWTGRFSWPEIDRPTIQQTAWNAAVRAKVTDWENVNEAEVTVTGELKAANQQLISLNLENSRYNYGAAHPNEETRSFNWWMRRQRSVKAEDVFRAGSGWEAALAELCYEQLKSGDRAKDLYEDAEVRQAVPSAAKEPDNWSLDARGLTVEFPEYSVAARVAGFFSTLIPWDRLRAYLASGFDPALLPQPSASNLSAR